MRAIPFTVLVLTVSCSSEVEKPIEPAPNSFAAEASRRATAFQLALRTELMQALQEGGPEKGIEVCGQRAPGIAASVSNDGFVVRRVGTRIRSAANSPSARDQEALAQFAARPSGDDSPLVVEGSDELEASLYLPIRIAESCLSCHGDPAAMSDGVKQALLQRYPSDRATGYALAELRGAVVVDRRR